MVLGCIEYVTVMAAQVIMTERGWYFIFNIICLDVSANLLEKNGFKDVTTGYYNKFTIWTLL